MEKTILTIDFDVIMWPSIELYNNLPSGWEDRIQRLPMLGNCLIDYDLYSRLTDLFIYLLNKTNIHFITHHDEVVSYLGKDNIYHIINIDHHHDWYYNEEDKDRVEKINCGNWIKYLNDNNMLSFYTWINTFNSNLCDDILNHDKIEFFKIDEVELKDFFIPDEVFICLSPDWIPPYIQPLYSIWKNIYKTKENIYV